MLKTEASGERSTLRSASPHRNAYRAEFQALKKAFDQPRVEAPPKPRGPEGARQPRGRQYGAHVSRIKDMFMQMTSEGVPAAPKTPKGPEEATPQKMTKPTNFINKSDGSVIKLQHSVSAERIAGGAGGSKFSETRKLFEQQSRDASQSPVYSYGRDKRGSHEHLDEWRGPRSNRGSTDSLDSLCSRTEASSPTVSQLSAVFENVDHLSQGAPVRRGYGGRGLYSPDGSHRHGDLSEDDSRQSPVRGLRSRVGGGKFPMSSSEEDLLSPSPLVELKPDPLREEPQERGTMAGEGKQGERGGLDGSTTANGTQINGSCESLKPTVEDKVVPLASRPSKDTADGGETPSKVPDTPGRADSEPQTEAEVPGEKQTPSPPKDQAEEGQEEYRGNERVIFNADGDACYQGWGESCTDPEDDLYGDEDEDVVYDPGADLTEIPGLPEEDHEEIPPSRKIRFSTAPMMVFNTYCNEDYDRRNEEVDPVASSAEYELEKRVEKLELFPVELEKDEDGLGISIIGMGVGADAGLEKLGIFVKTVIEGGAAERDDRIKVNDQMVEVDGTSLVGVTQSFAASVLRNTHGVVRFVIGRERPGQVSEVASLIQQTLEQEKRQREALEQQYAQYDADDDEQTGEYATDEEEEDVGPATTGGGGEKSIEVFDLPESDDIISPSELDATKLYQKFRELQLKHTVTEAEIQKLKNKLQAVEREKHRWEREKSQLKASIEENKDRMLKLEGYWIEAQTLCHTVNEHLKEAQAQYQTLDKKYNKAKKLIKDFQQKEVEFVQKEDAERKRLEDAEKAHLAEIQGLQVRIAALESELLQLIKQNGLQVNNNNNSFQQSPGRAGLGTATEVRDSGEVTSRPSRDSISSTETEVSECHSSPVSSLRGSLRGGAPIEGVGEGSPRHAPLQQGAAHLQGCPSPAVSSPSLSLEENTVQRGLGPGSLSRRSISKVQDPRASPGNSSTEPSGVDGEEKLKAKNPLAWPHFFSYSNYLGPAPGDDISCSSSSSAEVSGVLTDSKTSARSLTLGLSSDESLDVIEDEILDEPQVPKQLQSLSVSDWSSQQVAHWLLGLNLEHHIPQFTATNVDGERLLQLGSAELKALGVSSSQDRALIKKKVKDLKVLMEKARRSRDKQEKLHRKELDLLQKHTRKSSETAEGAAE
ncbi:neurabin-1 [Osmerus mordax]|uniref:neurabin-1 n=1 Tax=Osmerus mordax TaxID=8014 RepID=UPI0035103A6A